MTGAPSEENPLDTPDIETGRWLFSQPCDFLRGVVDMKGLPATALAEVAFAGRSNVGKSSLINALTGRKTLARTSNTPGRTKELNFFVLGPSNAPAVMLVDLPGYGYARETKSRVNQWTALVMSYLRGRAPLRRVFVLIDARHGLKDNDEEVMAMLDEAAVSYQIVLTKADKLKAGEIDTRLAEVRERLRTHVAAHPRIVITSSEKGTGIAELRAEIASLADPAALGYKSRTN
ncbi:ribosome biogenesis GTP-binding protein YihA/YsxC [Parvibaculum sp.]|uniref:ribosome biogenesis GTP-binding protein YihA/YsxC n=1 Tax=Parvibaculum sp. TaxID=2024848 RepID=UPI001B06A51D|nr:ribosome biogenesis GTP-binding protein YihA/YsxC [Parvibaculum sp.]MBO6636082.1 YihA family ribosome biogenesis GTP-binding protein [Parvibaculum sp.]MBO6677945.1 YihA family ribosome biogenesis GTP-binding protein [Parvibaculum sp.]MBO6683420.1 YihA family ribosome biogenesis GTP-binding protein [Parvibaculum sp.]MBO6906396.1 YihA family ribosome biogenesis GTP-binding protein [Parvibaculum sp.]